MKKFMFYNLPVLFSQLVVFAAALVLTLSFGFIGKGFSYSKEVKIDTFAVHMPELTKEDKQDALKIVQNGGVDEVIATPFTIKFVKQDGTVVYAVEEGTESMLTDPKIAAYLSKSNFLMEVGNEHFYLLK